MAKIGVSISCYRGSKEGVDWVGLNMCDEREKKCPQTFVAQRVEGKRKRGRLRRNSCVRNDLEGSRGYRKGIIWQRLAQDGTIWNSTLRPLATSGHNDCTMIMMMMVMIMMMMVMIIMGEEGRKRWKD